MSAKLDRAAIVRAAVNAKSTSVDAGKKANVSTLAKSLSQVSALQFQHIAELPDDVLVIGVNRFTTHDVRATLTHLGMTAETDDKGKFIASTMPKVNADRQYIADLVTASINIRETMIERRNEVTEDETPNA